MIKVLDKAFRILEEVAMASPRAVSPGKLAELAGINKATCSRIIKDLVNFGYIRQISRIEGYTAGPRLYSMGLQTSYKREIVDVSAPLVNECAKAIGQSVLLAEALGNERYILVHRNFNPAMNIELDRISYNDLCATATGIMLLAYMDEKDAQGIIDSSEANRLLKTLCNGDGPADFLSKIRFEKKVLYCGEAHHLAVAAFPVFLRNRFVAALGVSVPKNEFNDISKKNILREVNNTADKISRELSGTNSLG